MPDAGRTTLFSLQRRRWLHSIPAVPAIVLAAVIGGVVVSFAAPPDNGGGPPPTVTVAHVRTREINPPDEFVGRMEAIQAVDLRARVEGFMERVAFQEGAFVDAGDLLFVIEQAPYKAGLSQARAKVTEAEAALTRARQYLQRLQTVKSGGISAMDLEAAQSDEQQAVARLQEAKANLAQAELNLGYTTIRAPIAGRIGRSAYTRGNLVGPGSGALARIVQVDPIRVVYSMSDTEYLDLRSGSEGTREDWRSRFVPHLRMPDGNLYDHPGRLDFIDNQVDPNTGTIAVRAVFDNPRGILLPGQYVTVTVLRSQARRLPVIPQSAVLEDARGRYVFVVDDQDTVRKRPIVTGGVIENRWIVQKGLNAGETIIVQGVQKVTPGQVVHPVLENDPPKE